MYTHMRMYVGVHLCVCVHVCKSIFMFTCVCLDVCCSITDPLVRPGLDNRRFIVVPVADPIYRPLEDRSMRWSVDQYRFVQ